MCKLACYISLLFGGLVFSVGSYAELTETESLLAQMALLQNDEHLLKVALAEGEDRALLCGNCHGKDGNSVRNYIPNLASQNPAYLFNQFELFASGERKDYVMSRLAKHITKQERVNIALYFSRMPVKRRSQPTVSDAASNAKGEQIYNGLCFTCHQKDGHGNGSYPRIAGQPFIYLEKTLNGFAGGDHRRDNSPMAIIVEKMNKQQLRDVAAYVANMP
ncbi:MAG: cytochrome c553 [Oleispira sp.]|jgi:cytochrome c553